MNGHVIGLSRFAKLEYTLVPEDERKKEIFWYAVDRYPDAGPLCIGRS